VHLLKSHLLFSLTLALGSFVTGRGESAVMEDMSEMKKAVPKSASKGEGVQVRSSEEGPFLGEEAFSVSESDVTRPEMPTRAQALTGHTGMSQVIISDILLDSMFAIGGPIVVGDALREEFTIISGGPNSYSQSVSTFSVFSSPGFSGSVPGLREVSRGGSEPVQPGGMLGLFLDSFLKGVEQQDTDAQSSDEFDWIVEDVSSTTH